MSTVLTRLRLINHPPGAPGLLWSNLADCIQEMDAEGIDVEPLRSRSEVSALRAD